MFNVIDKSSILLNKMLDITALKQRVIANNIANVNTPGYQRRDVSFDSELKESLRDSESIEKVGLKVVISNDKGAEAALRKDKNTVNMDKEITELMKNTLSYNTYIELMSKKFRLIKDAISSR